MTENYIVTVGIQGPPGPTDFGKARVSRVAGESLAAYVVVAVASDGKVYRASKSTPEHVSRVLGLTLAAAAINAAVDVHLFGEVTNGAWTFDTTKLICLGDDGALTQSAPTSGFVLVLGYPTSAGSMFVVPGVSAILASAGAGDAGKVVALNSAGELALSFIPATLTGKDTDTVDGYHAGNAVGKLLVLDGSALVPLAQVPATLTGKDADTVDGYHASSLAKSGANSDITSLTGNITILDGNFYLSDADIAHGITDWAPTAVYGRMGALSGVNGGCNIIGLSDADAEAMYIQGVVGSSSPTVPAMVFAVQKKAGAGAGAQVVGNSETAYRFKNYSSDLVSILGSGNVGIGTTAPSSLLHIKGAGVVDVRIEGGHSWRIVSDSATNPDFAANALAFRDPTAGVTPLVLLSSGNVGVNTSSQFGAGVGVIGIANAVSVSSSNPSGGVVFYVDPVDGKLKYRSESGETRTLSYTI